MSESSGDRIHAATPQRRRLAREQGHVARSQDLASTAVLLGSLATLMYFGGRVTEFLLTQMREYLGGDAWLKLDAADVTHLGARLVLGLALALSPILALSLVWGLLSTLLQIGFLWLPQQVAPDLSRISPLRGLGRMASLNSAARLAFAVVKIALVGGVAFYSLNADRDAIAGAMTLDLPQLARFMAETVLNIAFRVGGTLLALGLLDFGFQWWKRERDLRMTTQEIRDELRNTQGPPQSASGRRKRSAQR